MENPKCTSSISNDDARAASTKSVDCSYNRCITEHTLEYKRDKTSSEITPTPTFSVYRSGSHEAKLETEDTRSRHKELEVPNETIVKTNCNATDKDKETNDPTAFTEVVTIKVGPKPEIKKRAKIFHLTRNKTNNKCTDPD